MYKQFQRILDDLTTITPLEKQNVQTASSDADADTNNESDEVHPELPLNYAKPEYANQYHVMDTTYEYKSANSKSREFYYLQDELNKQFDCQGTRTIHLCIFAFNDSCSFDGEPYPFLQFLAKKATTYGFPSFVFECPPNLDEEQLQIHFKNNCLKEVLDFFVIEGSNLHTHVTDNMSRSYRGFIDNDNDIYAVYDMTNFMKLPMRSVAKSVEWCLLSELNDTNLSDVRVVDFFDKYRYMSTIQSNTTIAQPTVMYLYDIAKRELVVNSKKQSILEPRSSHPLFGNFYYFVDYCLLSNRECRKYAVFIENMVEMKMEFSGGTGGSGDGQKHDVEYISEPEEETLEKPEEEDTMFEYSDDESLDEIVNDPFSEEPSEEPISEPITEPISEPISEPSEEPIPEPIKEPTSEPLPELIPEPIKEPTSEPISEPIPEPITEPISEPTPEPSQPSPDYINEYSMPFTSIIKFKENNQTIWCVKTESLFTEL